MVSALVDQCVEERGIIQYCWEVRWRAYWQCSVGSVRHYSAAPQFDVAKKHLQHWLISKNLWQYVNIKCKGKVHPCTGNEALYRPYGP